MHGYRFACLHKLLRRERTHKLCMEGHLKGTGFRAPEETELLAHKEFSPSALGATVGTVPCKCPDETFITPESTGIFVAPKAPIQTSIGGTATINGSKYSTISC